VGFRRAAEAALPGLSAHARGALETYARGASAYLAADSARPAEFTLLRAKAEPFTAVDSLTWAKMMAWDLGQNARDEIRRAAYVVKVGPERAAQMFPEVPETPTILLDEEWAPGFGSPASSGNPGVGRAAGPASRISSRHWERLDAAFGAPRRASPCSPTIPTWVSTRRPPGISPASRLPASRSSARRFRACPA
jgi:acyl-homoserine lactone acylase PvdQ